MKHRRLVTLAVVATAHAARRAVGEGVGGGGAEGEAGEEGEIADVRAERGDEGGVAAVQ